MTTENTEVRPLKNSSQICLDFDMLTVMQFLLLMLLPTPDFSYI